jgi:hypothetical protein
MGFSVAGASPFVPKRARHARVSLVVRASFAVVIALVGCARTAPLTPSSANVARHDAREHADASSHAEAIAPDAPISPSVVWTFACSSDFEITIPPPVAREPIAVIPACGLCIHHPRRVAR